MNEEGPEDLRTRTRRFALQAIRLSRCIRSSEEGTIIRRQFLRSATSVGAQYREACRARSDAEFVSKMESAQQELDETQYWLELIGDADLCPGAIVQPVAQETDEHLRFFTTIIRRRKCR